MSKEASLEVLVVLWSLFFKHLAIFCVAAGKAVGPLAHDEEQLKSVVDEV
jgi:hypothetical protein